MAVSRTSKWKVTAVFVFAVTTSCVWLITRTTSLVVEASDSWFWSADLWVILFLWVVYVGYLRSEGIVGKPRRRPDGSQGS